MYLLNNRCLICSCPGHSLCSRCERLYILDLDNGWVRKKLKLQKDVKDKNSKYHKTERKLFEIIKIIFGKENVISSLHPLWALSDKKVLMEYDIGVVSEKLLLEYDGVQHFEYPNFFHRSRSEFNEQIKRDRLKEEIALDNGWNLLRIKYTETVTYGSIIKRLRGKGYAI